MQPAPAVPSMIPAGSHHQAMDWSLVLVSQGIESIVDHDAEGGTWRLIVPDVDRARALEAIRLYVRENRGGPWRQELPWTGLVFDWRCVVWFLLLMLLYAVEATGHGDLRQLGMMNGLAVKGGEWWRAVTAVTLHGDLAHLAANVTTGLLLLGLAMGAYGPGLGLGLSLAAGVIGNLTGMLVYPDSVRGLGASGLIMGSLGLLSAQSVGLLRHGLSHRQLAGRGVLGGCLLLVLLGFSPERNADVVGHVAGFLGGAFLGALAVWLPAGWRRSGGMAWVGQILVGAVLVICWALALRVGRPL